MRRTLAVPLFALVCSTAVYAQAVVGSGAVTGVIYDRFGDGIPDTTVTLTNKVAGVSRIMMTSDSGVFDAPGLIPAASYSMKVTRRGYADWELASFDLSVGETLNFRITLYADKAATPAEAQRSLAPVQDSKTSITALVTEDQFNNLPIDARIVDKMILLAPELTEAPDGTLVFRAVPRTNAFYLDGINTTNTFFLNRPGISPFLSADSVSETQVISEGATPEFGHSMTGIVNTVTKSGANRLHANAYDYYDQNSWNATDPFGHGFVPTGRSNLAGASVGLPVSTDTLFLFGDLERGNISSQGLNRITNPQLTDPTGNTVLTSGCTATTAQCNSAAQFIGSQMNVKVPMSQISDSGFARMDFRPNEHESFTLAGAIFTRRGVNEADNATVDPNNGLFGSNADVTDSFRYGTFAWTHVMSTHAVNEFHGFWMRDAITAITNPVNFPTSTPVCQVCGTGPIAITVDGTPLGGNPVYPFTLREARFGGTDIFTKTVAEHTIRGGADITRTTDTMSQLYSSFGQYNFDSFSAFATDFTADVKGLKDYATFVQTFGNADTNLTSFSFHLFAQDTWKVSPRFVVVVGLRWEKERLPQPTEPNPTTYQSGFIPSPNTNFNPRIGFAFMLDKRTVIRAGGGTYYQPFSGQLIRDLFTGGAIYQNYFELVPQSVGAPVFPKPLPTTAPNTLALGYFGQFYTADRFRNPYTEQGSLAIERRLNRYMSLAANIVLSQGLKLWTATDQNLPGGTSTTENYVIDNAQGLVVNNYSALVWNKAIAGHKYQVDTEGYSRYRGATAQMRTVPIFGLSVQASYTYSIATDDMSGPPAYSLVPSTFFPGAYTDDKAHSAFDQRHRAVIDFTWQPVVSKKNNAVSRFLLNGWALTGIANYASSMHVTPTVEVQGQQFSGIVMDYTSNLFGTDGWSRSPVQSVNTIPLGAQFHVDARLSRSLPFTERLRGRLMLELFNATNHQNNTSVNTTAYTAANGTLTPAIGLGTPTGDYSSPTGSGARRMQVAFRLDF